MLGIALTKVYDLALGLIEFCEVCMGLPLKVGKFPLDGIASLQHADCTMQLGDFRKLAKCVLCPVVHVTDKDNKTALVSVLTSEEHHLSLVSIIACV